MWEAGSCSANVGCGHACFPYLQDHVGSIQSLLKRHEDFERVLLVLKKRVNAVNEHGYQLVERGHFASDTYVFDFHFSFI